MRTWARANRRRRKKPPKCVSCSKPIPRSEPDVTLENLNIGGRLYFHERCALDAYKALVGGEPGVWRITHRHIDERMN